MLRLKVIAHRICLRASGPERTLAALDYAAPRIVSHRWSSDVRCADLIDLRLLNNADWIATRIPPATHVQTFIFVDPLVVTLTRHKRQYSNQNHN